MSSHISLICSSNILHIFPFSDFLFYMVQPQRLSRSQDLSLFPTYTNDLRTSRLLLLIDRLSMTFTANGKNETFVVSLQLCVQQSEIMCICNEKQETLSPFRGLYLRIRRKELTIRSFLFRLPSAVNVIVNLSNLNLFVDSMEI